MYSTATKKKVQDFPTASLWLNVYGIWQNIVTT